MAANRLMITRMLILLSACAVAAPALAQVQPNAAPVYVDPLRRALPAAEYVRRAAASDVFQRQSAQVMLKGSRHPVIRRLAQMFFADHGRAAADLRAAAAKSGVRIAANLTTVEYDQMLGKLNLTPPANRDLLYLAQQRAVHQRALAMHEDYAKGGDQPALREAAARIAEIERAHLDLVRTIDLAAPIATSAPAPTPPSQP